MVLSQIKLVIAEGRAFSGSSFQAKNSSAQNVPEVKCHNVQTFPISKYNVPVPSKPLGPCVMMSRIMMIEQQLQFYFTITIGSRLKLDGVMGP